MIFDFLHITDVGFSARGLVLTKFDMFVSKLLFDITRGDILQHGRVRVRAHAMCEESLRRQFDKDPRNVSAEIVSGAPSFSISTSKVVI